MNFKKKAIEPIVATILLVVVAVILVTIVLAWGKNFTTGGLNEAGSVANDACKGAAISLESCDWNGAGLAILKIKNISDTYTIAADDLSCNITNDANVQNNQQTIATAATTALAPGATLQTTCTSTTVTSATKVTVNVRSETCPTTAVSEIKGCS